ncbi:MAG: chromosomal replication initiator protein DnaA [Candidatus Aminicenantes bacterium]|nr:chromosomal replication initiator protein DnaA [Candidatus Aminicenantes bacterium]
MTDFNTIKSHIKEILDIPTFEKYIVPLEYIGENKGNIFLGSPEKNKMIWIKNNVLTKINSNLKDTLKIAIKIVPLFEEAEEIIEQPRMQSKTVFNSNLQKKFIFDTFTQTNSNRMAHSFAYNVSEFPGKSYNPLYIYSDVGLGKTHLMQAIGNRLKNINKNASVVYTTSSDFMNEYVEFTRQKQGTQIIKKYTSIDVLLIDDIQFITKWGGTREQFYNIFNKLIQMEKQIVICSDKHPDYIPDLEDRIKSRFEMGGIVDILPYSLEDRLAILKNKIAEKEIVNGTNFEIPEDVQYFLASSIKDNIRKLEGALNRLIGVADLTFSNKKGVILTLDFAKEALKPYIASRQKKVTIKSIQEFVSKKFEIKTSDIVSKNNSKKIVLPRQIAMYLSKTITNSSYVEIGSRFGGKDHSTVIYSIRKVKNMLAKDQEMLKKVNSYIKFFEN